MENVGADYISGLLGEVLERGVVGVPDAMFSALWVV